MENQEKVNNDVMVFIDQDDEGQNDVAGAGGLSGLNAQEDPAPVKRGFFDAIPKPAWIAIAVVFAVVIFGVVSPMVTGAMGAQELRQDLEGTWYDTDGTIIRVLELDDDNITYSIITGISYLDETLAEGKWRAIDGETIEVNFFGTWTKHSVQITDTKKGVMFWPALTSADSSEFWVQID